MRRAIGIGVAIAIVVISRVALTPSVDDEIVKACKKLNEKTPLMVDEVTRLDSAKALPMEIQYNYTIIGIEDLEVEDKTEFEKNTRNHVKSAKELRFFRDNGVDMSYRYKNEAGKEIITFTIEHSK